MRPTPLRYFDWIEITVTLRHISPPIWRKLHLPAEMPLGMLHEALQMTFGWENSHLHGFELGGLRFAPVDEEDEIFSIDEDGTPLGAVIGASGATGPLVYDYDFGDGWEHEIVSNGVVPPSEGVVCVDGARASPPEDCGGPPGYENLVQVLADVKHPEHAELRAWAGKKWDPEAFDRAAVAKKLAAFSRKIGLTQAAKKASKGPARG